MWLYCRTYGARFIAVEHTPLQIKSRVERTASVMLPALASRVVYLSEHYRDEMRRDLAFVPGMDRALVIHNGIDTERYAPVTRTRGENGALAFGMIGRFSSAKKQLVLVKAFAALLRSGERVGE